jgi:hypothetical protein
VVVEVKPGDEVTSLSVGWLVEKYLKKIAPVKAEKPARKKAAAKKVAAKKVTKPVKKASSPKGKKK